ncbi:hypothetical protein Vretifemale_8556 [Volvox reticuliferus]|uniref:RAP domain-containing protein n=1 Tax=Volvox reticuliferus TaxID=1737510 RepID=A0A8J4FPL0_9CHLO|nr:hypothetical protein Vretifemale_8556 [Volvox reticuliferus]
MNAAAGGDGHEDGDGDGGVSGGDRGGGGGGQEGLIPDRLLRKCCERALATMQNLSNLLWALAKLGYRHDALLGAAAAQAARQMADSRVGAAHGAGGAAEGVRGAGGGGCGGADDRSQGPSHWSSQSVSNSTWAFATLGAQPGGEYLEQVCRHLARRSLLSRFSWQHIANTVWALATLQHHDAEAMEAVEQEVAARLAKANTTEAEGGPDGAVSHRRELPSTSGLRSQHIANLLWGYGTLEHPAPVLFFAVRPIMERRVAEFSEQELSNSVWAAARLALYDRQLMDVIGDHISAARLPYLLPQHVANLAWAYSRLTHAHRALFDGLVARAVSYTSTPGALTWQHLTNVCSSAGVFGWRYPALVDVTERRLAACYRCYCGGGGGGGGDVQPLYAQQACNLAWGLSLVGSCSPRTWGQLMELLGVAVEAQGGVEELPPEALTQIYQAYLNVRLDNPTVTLAAGVPGLLHRGAQVWRTNNARGIQVSAFQKQVSHTLLRLGLRNQMERLTDDGHFSIDMAVEVEVEVDGDADEGEERPAGDGRWQQQPQLLERPQRQLGVMASEHLGEVHDWITPAQKQNPYDCTSRDDTITTPEFHGASMVTPHLSLLGAAPDKSPSPPTAKTGGADAVEAATATAITAAAPIPATDSDAATTANTTARARLLGASAPSRRRCRSRLFRVAVEADGPGHYTANTRQPLGMGLYRRRCLEERGWVVVTVAYWRWYEVSPAKRDLLLTELLREAGVGELLTAAVAAEYRRRVD